GGDLENVLLAVVVMGDHVHHVDAVHAGLSQTLPATVRKADLQTPLNQLLAQGPRAHAVGRELLAGQMYEPDVRFELALFGQVEEDRGGEHHGGGGRVVVVG